MFAEIQDWLLFATNNFHLSATVTQRREHCCHKCHMCGCAVVLKKLGRDILLLDMNDSGKFCYSSKLKMQIALKTHICHLMIFCMY